MSDRLRTGELLAAIGAVALSVLLAFGAWFDYDVILPGGRFSLSGAIGARHLGWFAVFVTILAAIAGLLFLARVLASPPHRAVLQGPVAYATALLALLVDAVRMIIFTPDVTVGGGALARDLGSRPLTLDTDVALGGWLALLALLLMVIGTWIAMDDERKDTPGAKLRTEALLAQSPVRPAPPVGPNDAAETDADTVAQDQVPDVASDPADAPTSDAPSTGDSA